MDKSVDQKKNRSSNIELLRIVAMVLIVAHHFSVHGGFAFDQTIISINHIWVQFLQLGGKFGVDVFVLISGYYLISHDTIKTAKVFKFWLQLFSYSIIIFAVTVFLGFAVFSKKALLDAFFPVSLSDWWFASTYFILFILSPFLNILLKSMRQQIYQKFLSVIIVLWCVLPTVSSLYPKFSLLAPEFSNLVWFITLYSVAAYIHLWHGSFVHNCKYYLVISACAYIFTFFTAVFFDYLNSIQTRIIFNAEALYGMTSLTLLIAAVFAVIGFLLLDISVNRTINVIASASFGVYLIHDHIIMRDILWVEIFKNAEYANSSLLIPYSIVVILIVYLACTIIELLRIYLLENNYMSTIEKASKVIDGIVGKIFTSSLSKKI